MPRSLQEGGGHEDEAVQGCPVCLEPLTEDQFHFPCGHGVCNGCNTRLEQRSFLSCPTCRTPREGVSQRQVDRSNRTRARNDYADAEQQLVVFAGGREYQVLFFPDESNGQDPFGPLQGHPFALHEIGRTMHEFSGADQATQEEALRAAEAAIEAEVEYHSEGIRLPLSRRPSTTLRGPMRDLMDSLLRPTSLSEFLAQREVVRHETQGGARATPSRRPSAHAAR